jgi:hypothetical protein
LHDNGATIGLDRLRADRAITAGAGQDHGDELFTKAVGRAGQEMVDRGSRAPASVRQDRNVMVSDLDVPVRRHNVDRSSVQGFTTGDGSHHELAPCRQERGELAGTVRIEMLCQDDRSREVSREASRQLEECFHSTR